jgi:uncharacterized protein YcgI (DUF1989 family)
MRRLNFRVGKDELDHRLAFGVERAAEFTGKHAAHECVGAAVPAGFVTLRVEADCIVVVSDRAQDILAINNRDPTPVAIELLDG